MNIKVIKPNAEMDTSDDSEGRYWDSDVVEIDLDLLLFRLSATLGIKDKAIVLEQLEDFLKEQLR